MVIFRYTELEKEVAVTFKPGLVGSDWQLNTWRTVAKWFLQRLEFFIFVDYDAIPRVMVSKIIVEPFVYTNGKEQGDYYRCPCFVHQRTVLGKEKCLLINRAVLKELFHCITTCCTTCLQEKLCLLVMSIPPDQLCLAPVLESIQVRQLHSMIWMVVFFNQQSAGFPNLCNY